MKVTAKQWIQYDGAWHPCGETFEVKDTDLTGMAGAVEPSGEPRPAEPGDSEQKPKRVKSRKTEA